MRKPRWYEAERYANGDTEWHKDYLSGWTAFVGYANGVYAAMMLAADETGGIAVEHELGEFTTFRQAARATEEWHDAETEKWEAVMRSAAKEMEEWVRQDIQEAQRIQAEDLAFEDRMNKEMGI